MGGAVEKFWFQAGEEFARRGHHVAIVSRAIPEFPAREIIDGVEHIRILGFNAPAQLLWLKLLDLFYSLRTIRALPDADIVVTNTFWLPLLLRRREAGRIYVHVARFPKGQVKFYTRASRLQAPSIAVARAIAKEAPMLADLVKSIPYAAPGSTESAPSIPARERILLFVGRVHPEKGVHLLIESFAQNAAGAFRDWRMVIVGSAEPRHGGGGKEYLASLRALGAKADAQIEFRGAIYDEELLAAEYKCARIFIYPSQADTGETFGLAALEAMSAGCATVVSALECFDDFVINDETGFRFDHRGNDPAGSLGALLVRIANDEPLLASVATGGLRKAEDYSLPNVATLFLNDFESLIANA